mmetsp:Transcript_8040/g.20845  ORF Transcript_8040/g.20845 Transcript_8040/m.20845 type:complete len:347 (+) Transcript_8040:895-1935(+)
MSLARPTCSRHATISAGAIPAAVDVLYAPSSSSSTVMANAASPFSSRGVLPSSDDSMAAVRSVGALMPKATVLHRSAFGESPSISSATVGSDAAGRFANRFKPCRGGAAGGGGGGGGAGVGAGVGAGGVEAEGGAVVGESTADVVGLLTLIRTDVPGEGGALSSIRSTGSAFGLTVTFIPLAPSKSGSIGAGGSLAAVSPLPPSLANRRSMRSNSLLPSGGSSACSSSFRSRISSTGMPIDCASIPLSDSRSSFWMEPELRSVSSISTDRSIALPPPIPSPSSFINSAICFWITSCISRCPLASLILSSGRSCSTASKPTTPPAASSPPKPICARSSGAASARLSV